MRSHAHLAFLALGAVLLGWAAHADDAPAPAPSSAPMELRCRLFVRTLADGGLLETHDTTTEVGQWVAAQAPEGWTVHDVQLAVGQKPTGYAQGWSQVCLRRPTPSPG